MQRNETPEDDMMRNLNDEALDSAKNSLATLINTREQGAATLEELQAQGKQLERTQQNVDEILYQQKIAEQHTNKISSIFWSITSRFRTAPTPPDHTVITSAPASTVKAPPPKKSVSTVKTMFNDDINTGSLPKSDAAKVRETDAVLDEMNDYLKDMTSMATQMNEELDRHNERIDVLNTTTNEANTNAKQLNGRIRGLIRK